MNGREEFEVQIGDTTHRVTVHPQKVGESCTRVDVDGQLFELDTLNRNEFIVRANDSARRERVFAELSGLGQVWHEGRTATASIISTRELALQRALNGGASAGGAGDVKTPMPGRVVRVLVEAGQHVEAGAPVAIVEAMKMENELHAPSTGRVEKIHVSAGDAVDAGQLLCSIVPEETPA